MRNDKSVLLPNETEQEIALVENRLNSNQKTTAHIWMTNGNPDAWGTNAAHTVRKATAAMALAYHHGIITAVHIVVMGVIDVKES